MGGLDGVRKTEEQVMETSKERPRRMKDCRSMTEREDGEVSREENE